VLCFSLLFYFVVANLSFSIIDRQKANKSNEPVISKEDEERMYRLADPYNEFVDVDEIVYLTGKQFISAIMGPFPETPFVQPFGSIEYPALIFSEYDSRVVGCVGGLEVHHQLLWFTLKGNKKHVCEMCGQVYQLVNDSNFDEHSHRVDERTRAHYEYFRTMKLKGSLPPVVKMVVPSDWEF
jgi:hypothetical protein